MKEKEHSYIVYAHISPGGKHYIGITKQNPLKRWLNGKGYSGNKHFTSAINLYGWDNFQHEIVSSGLTKTDACNFEKLLIEKLDTRNPDKGYNISLGGDLGTTGLKHTEESKQKMKNILSDGRRKGKNSCNYGKQHSIDTRIKMSKNHADVSGKNNPMYGKAHDSETRLKLSDANKGKKLSDETIEKIKRSKSWYKHSEETINKIINARQIRVICTTTGMIFNSIKEAGEYYCILKSHISSCCRKTRNYCGKHPETNEPLKWMYYDEYLKESI